VPCKQCNEVLYCSDSCWAANYRFHKHDCVAKDSFHSEDDKLAQSSEPEVTGEDTDPFIVVPAPRAKHSLPGPVAPCLSPLPSVLEDELTAGVNSSFEVTRGFVPEKAPLHGNMTRSPAAKRSFTSSLSTHSRAAEAMPRPSPRPPSLTPRSSLFSVTIDADSSNASISRVNVNPAFIPRESSSFYLIEHENRTPPPAGRQASKSAVGRPFDSGPTTPNSRKAMVEDPFQVQTRSAGRSSASRAYQPTVASMARSAVNGDATLKRSGPIRVSSAATINRSPVHTRKSALTAKMAPGLGVKRTWTPATALAPAAVARKLAYEPTKPAPFMVKHSESKTSTLNQAARPFLPPAAVARKSFEPTKSAPFLAEHTEPKITTTYQTAHPSLRASKPFRPRRTLARADTIKPFFRGEDWSPGNVVPPVKFETDSEGNVDENARMAECRKLFEKIELTDDDSVVLYVRISIGQFNHRIEGPYLTVAEVASELRQTLAAERCDLGLQQLNRCIEAGNMDQFTDLSTTLLNGTTLNVEVLKETNVEIANILRDAFQPTTDLYRIDTAYASPATANRPNKSAHDCKNTLGTYTTAQHANHVANHLLGLWELDAPGPGWKVDFQLKDDMVSGMVQSPAGEVKTVKTVQVRKAG
jgi:hypothetical protein